jgi:hypothetical protein
MKRSILLLLSFAVTAWGCTPEKQPGVEEIIEIPTVGDLTNDSDDNIANTSFKSTITITFAASGASVAGDDAGIVKINGNQVTATNTGSDAIKYVLTGTSDNGFFKLYSGKKQALVLKDLNLTNPSGAAINNQSKKRTFVVLEGTNKLADGATYTMSGTEDQKAAFFSEAQLIFSGDGTLDVTATGKNGIASDDYIRFLGKQTVNVSSSAGHGIRGKDYILVDDGTINVSVSADMKKGFSSDSLVRITGGVSVIKVTGGTAFDDEDQDYSSSAGIKADKTFEMSGGSLTITNSGKGGKGIRVGSSTVMETLGTSYVSGGAIDITTTGAAYPYTLNGTSDTKSPKGIKIGWAVKKNEHTFSDFSGDFVVTGGKIAVRSTNAEAIEVKKTLEIQGGEVFAWSQTEDAINSASTFTISGGHVCGISLGNDALDANGNFYVKGGVVFASGAGNPELAIDANTEGGFKLYVTGGTIFALGGLESGASLTQACYQASSWSTNKYYSITVGEDTYVFKTPSSGGTKLVVSGASKPEVKSSVTVSGGTEIFGGYGVVNGTVSGGSAVTLSSYTNSGDGPGGRW